MSQVLQNLSIFTAGLLTSVSPCVYPTLPLTVSYLSFQSRLTNSKKPVIFFFLGQSLSYVLIGYLAVKLGEVFGFTSQSKTINLIIATILFAMAFISLSGFMPSSITSKSDVIRKKIEKLGSTGIWGSFLIGFAAALVASPCASPILGGVLTNVAAEPWSIVSFLKLFFYGLGASLLILVIGLGLIKSKSLPKSGKWLTWVHKGTGLLILAASFYYFYKALN